MSKSAFIDEVEINVTGGDGGNGIISFLRERARPFGGPDGGDGGRGGHVLMTVDNALNTLAAFRYQRNISAQRGKSGGGGNRHGANGTDKLLYVPPGTRVIDTATGALHVDLTAAAEPAVLARGGRGGFGNAHFKSSVNRTPRQSTPGEAGEQRAFRLELAVMADVGLLGLPNVGKSTFLRAVSAARPKVAAYPFTTLEPKLGWVELERGGAALIIADIPGIIRGAASGAGLGNRFLRHLSRTTLLCQLVDATSATVIEDCRDIDSELRQADELGLADKPRWLLLNKIDQVAPAQWREQLRRLRQTFPAYERVLALSALTGEGVRDCIQQLLERRQAA